MSLKKSLKNNLGQSVVEFILLIAICLIALIGTNLFSQNGPFVSALNNTFNIIDTRIKVY